MKININGKEMEREEVSSLLFDLSHTPRDSLAYSRPTWVKCLTCGEGKEFCIPTTALDFISNHERNGCNEFDITVSRSLVGVKI